jgi:phosphate uptake regulator
MDADGTDTAIAATVNVRAITSAVINICLVVIHIHLLSQKQTVSSCFHPSSYPCKESFLIDEWMDIDNMSRFSLVLLNDSVEAFLRRDYYLADKIGDKVEDVRSLENDIIRSLDKVKTSVSGRNESISVNIKLILEDIRRTAEHASDIAEAAMNETVSEVTVKISTDESKTKSLTNMS